MCSTDSHGEHICAKSRLRLQAITTESYVGLESRLPFWKGQTKNIVLEKFVSETLFVDNKVLKRVAKAYEMKQMFSDDKINLKEIKFLFSYEDNPIPK